MANSPISKYTFRTVCFALVAVAAGSGGAGLVGIFFAKLDIAWLTYPLMALGFTSACYNMIRMFASSIETLFPAATYAILTIMACSFIAALAIGDEALGAGAMWGFAAAGPLLLPVLYLPIVIVRLCAKSADA